MTAWALGLAATASVLAFGGAGPLLFLPAQLLILLAAAVQFWRKGFPPVSRAAGVLIAALGAIGFLQITPLPDSLLEVVAPGRMHLVREFAAAGTSLQLPATLSLQPHETVLALTRLVCYLLVFLLAFQDQRREAGSAALPAALIGIGVFEALYGLAQYLTGWHYIFTYAKTINTSMATGTYINYNHYAGLLEMVLPFLLVRLWLTPRHSGAELRYASWRQVLSGHEAGSWLGWFALFLLVFLALLFSHSRSGILAGIAGLVVAGAPAVSAARKGRGLAMALLLAALLLLYSLWIGLAPVLQRFEHLMSGGTAEEIRFLVWADTLKLIGDFPWLGSGLGTYPWISLHYQSLPVTLRYEHAHNDYLELAAEIGVVAALVLIVSLWGVALRAARQSLVAERWREKRLAAACAGSMIALLIHAATDYNLQMPANALVFSWITGTAAGLLGEAKNTSWQHGREEQRPV